MKKKAFTLIELVITLCITSILLSVEIRILVRDIRSFQRNLSCVVKYCSMQEALSFIDNCIYLKDDVKIENNSILIKDKKDNKMKKIKLVGNELQIYDRNLTGYNSKKTKNVICKNIKKFIIKRNGKVVFIKLGDHRGEECKKFIPLEN